MNFYMYTSHWPDRRTKTAHVIPNEDMGCQMMIYIFLKNISLLIYYIILHVYKNIYQHIILLNIFHTGPQKHKICSLKNVLPPYWNLSTVMTKMMMGIIYMEGKYSTNLPNNTTLPPKILMQLIFNHVNGQYIHVKYKNGAFESNNYCHGIIQIMCIYLYFWQMENKIQFHEPLTDCYGLFNRKRI